jgi:hypothetical protein
MPGASRGGAAPGRAGERDWESSVQTGAASRKAAGLWMPGGAEGLRQQETAHGSQRTSLAFEGMPVIDHSAA